MSDSENTINPVHDGDNSDAPFRVIVQSRVAVSQCETVQEPESMDDVELSLDDIEAAYLRALETAELAESLTPEFVSETPPDREIPLPESPATDSNSFASLEHQTGSVDLVTCAPGFPVDQAPPSQGQIEMDTTLEVVGQETADEPVLRAEQVIEAMLFVGGAPLTVKKFLDILGGAHKAEQVESMVEAINLRYLSQRRPYEVRLVEGGYQLQLASEYESVRSRAYGHGPKEVKLAQDALEVLAFVAYQQPVGRKALEETGKQNVPGLLRQLVRRELLSVDRSDPEAGERYRTTSRFLELFGLSALEDLPQAGTFNFK